jgi:3-hydroxyacyl-CoA dehydrogenase
LVPDLAQDLESLGDVLFVTGVFASKNTELPELALGASTPVVTLGWQGVGRRNALGLELATEDLTGDRQAPAKLVELISSADTPDEVVSTVVTLLRRMRRSVIPVRNRAVGPSLIRAMRSALLQIEDQQGVAPVMDLLQRWNMAGADAADARAGRDLFAGVAPEVLAALANAGLRMIGEGRVTRASDIDLIFSTVYGFPRWGGRADALGRNAGGSGAAPGFAGLGR